MDEKKMGIDVDHFRMALQSICDCYGEEAMKPIPLYKKSRAQVEKRDEERSKEGPCAN